MRIHLDTDVIIDMITDRHPWSEDSAWVLDWAKLHPMQGSLAWHSLANLFYLTDMTREFSVQLMSFLKIPAVSNQEFRQSMKLDLKDAEDAMQVGCALLHQADYIITRNLRHYRKSPIPALSPKEFRLQHL